jgi:hypothetical protein
MSSRFKYPVGTKENVAVVALLDDSINGQVTGIVPSTAGWTRDGTTKVINTIGGSYSDPTLMVIPYSAKTTDDFSNITSVDRTTPRIRVNGNFITKIYSGSMAIPAAVQNAVTLLQDVPADMDPAAYTDEVKNAIEAAKNYFKGA